MLWHSHSTNYTGKLQRTLTFGCFVLQFQSMVTLDRRRTSPYFVFQHYRLHQADHGSPPHTQWGPLKPSRKGGKRGKREGKHPRPQGTGPGTGKGRHWWSPAMSEENLQLGDHWVFSMWNSMAGGCGRLPSFWMPQRCFLPAWSRLHSGSIHCLSVIQIMPVHPSEILP